MGVDYKPDIPDSDLNPSKGAYSGQKKLKFWCQKVLPLVYDDSLSYYETICRVVQKLNELAEKYNQVDDLINNLDQHLTIEVTRILHEWYEDGTLDEIIGTALDNIAGDVSDLSDDVSDINTAITGINSSITSLTAGVGAAAAMAQDAAEAALKHSLNGKYCLLMGNSYAYGTDGIGGQGWCYYFQLLTGCQGEIIALRGGDFCSNGNNNTVPEYYRGKNYLTAMEYCAENILSASQRAQYEYIIVGGGYNDRNKSGVEDAVIAFCSRARTLFPNAEIWIVPLYPGRRLSTSLTDPDVNHPNVYNAGVQWINGAVKSGAATNANTFSWFYGETSLHAGDAVHLNDLGYQMCGKMIAALVCGWDGLTQSEIETNAVLYEGITSVGFRCYRKGDRVSIGGALKLPDSPVISRVNLATLNPPFRPSTIKFFSAFAYGDSASTRTVCTAAINASTGILSLENTSADIQSASTIYLAIDYTIVI